MNLIARLILLSDLFAAEGGLSRSQQSYRIFSDSRRLDAVADGRAQLRVDSYERALLWLSDNWPDEVSWPDGVERPSAVEAHP